MRERRSFPRATLPGASGARSRLLGVGLYLRSVTCNGKTRLARPLKATGMAAPPPRKLGASCGPREAPPRLGTDYRPSPLHSRPARPWRARPERAEGERRRPPRRRQRRPPRRGAAGGEGEECDEGREFERLRGTQTPASARLVPSLAFGRSGSSTIDGPR